MSETYLENPHSGTVRGIVADLRERLEKFETHPLGPTYVRMDLDYATRDLEGALGTLEGEIETDLDPCDECDEKGIYIRELKALLRKHKIDVPKADYEA